MAPHFTLLEFEPQKIVDHYRPECSGTTQSMSNGCPFSVSHHLATRSPAWQVSIKTPKAPLSTTFRAKRRALRAFPATIDAYGDERCAKIFLTEGLRKSKYSWGCARSKSGPKTWGNQRKAAGFGPALGSERTVFS